MESSDSCSTLTGRSVQHRRRADDELGVAKEDDDPLHILVSQSPTLFRPHGVQVPRIQRSSLNWRVLHPQRPELALAALASRVDACKCGRDRPHGPVRPSKCQG